MRALDISLERIFKRLIDGNAGLAIAETETYLEAWPNRQTREKLDTMKEQYRLMESYWQQGVKDPQMDAQYLRLLQGIYRLCANVAIHRHIAASSFLQQVYTQSHKPGQQWSLDSVRQEMEGFVADIAMLELEPEQLRAEKSRSLYRQHQQQMNMLFNFIVTSHVWTDGVGQNMEEMLLLPTIDSADQQLVTTAVSLSLMNCFDIAKFRLLVHVYQLSHDEEVRQRALVGWVLGIDDDFMLLYPEQRSLVEQLLQSKRCQQEVAELQIQLVYTLDSEKETTAIQEEIVPDIMKNNSVRLTRNGIEEIEDDPLEDVLHPDAAEQRMERLEASFARMMDMQKKGVDIYFGGFSQMKRFPFFYDMSNWLVPFFLKHPDIEQFVDKLQGNKFLNYIVAKAPFCNSDKYSFVMVFQQVMDKMPESMRQLMKKGELKLAEIEQEEQHEPAYIRRLYLMDLFRFFRLFPNRSALFNPFDTAKQQMGMCLFLASRVFSDTPLEASKPTLVALLKKRKLEHAAQMLLASFPQSMHDVQYYLWTGDYVEALALEPDNERALVGHARWAFERGQYDEAQADYARLQLLHPEKKRYMLNSAVCLVEMGDYEEATRLLYQLNYEESDNSYVNRTLAWALTSDGKLEQAEKLYRQMEEQGQAEGEDLLNMGYCLWLQHRLGEAASYFRQYVQRDDVSSDDFEFREHRLLHANGITDTDIRMMEALVLR